MKVNTELFKTGLHSFVYKMLTFFENEEHLFIVDNSAAIINSHHHSGRHNFHNQ